MKHKVKLVKVEGDFFDALVDGIPWRYMIQRPQPLGPGDAAMVRAAMDTRMIEAIFASDVIADYLEKVGTVIDIGKGVKGIVILKSDVDKIRKGGMG